MTSNIIPILAPSGVTAFVGGTVASFNTLERYLQNTGKSQTVDMYHGCLEQKHIVYVDQMVVCFCENLTFRGGSSHTLRQTPATLS